MPSSRRLIAGLLMAAVVGGCSMPSIDIRFLLPSATIPVPSATALTLTDTPTLVATETPIHSTPTQPTSTFTPIPTFTATFTPIATLTSAATATPTATSTPGPAGISIGYGNVTLLLSGSLGTDTSNTTSTDVEFPYLNPSNGEMPQHVKFVINGYPVQGTVLQPQVLIFPAAKYAEYTDLTRQIVATLRGTTYFDGQPLPAGLPDGPFNAHVQSVQFANGHGIRYLTQFNQALLPVNNRELIYYFHGISDSGDSYVEAILPLQASFLAADEDPGSPLPAGGIPFNTADPGGYFRDIANRLNATPPDGFAPSLSTLDALIQSIYVGSAP